MSHSDTRNVPITLWKPGTPIPRPANVPFASYVNYREVPPEGLEVSDVELIWWTAAASFSLLELRQAIMPTIDRQTDWGNFRFHPIADKDGNGRYPQAIVLLLIDLLPKGVVFPVDEDVSYSNGEPCEVVNAIIIQQRIWHELTRDVLLLCPKDQLPSHLLEFVLCADLGL
ncbi:MAG TPA: hypothetical protein VF682_20800 [Pseudomonas sp.]